MTQRPPSAPATEQAPTSFEPPILEHEKPSAEHEQLAAFFAEAEIKQIELLDQAGKRIIELTTLLLGILFTVVAFGDKFPPPYLAGNPYTKLLSIVTLACYVVAMLLSLRAVQPRNYRNYRYNLAGMREEFDRIVANKKRSLRWAGITFWVGAVCMAILIGIIVLAA